MLMAEDLEAGLRITVGLLRSYPATDREVKEIVDHLRSVRQTGKQTASVA